MLKEKVEDVLAKIRVGLRADGGEAAGGIRRASGLRTAPLQSLLLSLLRFAPQPSGHRLRSPARPAEPVPCLTREAFCLLGSPCLLHRREVAPFGPSDNGAIIGRGLEVTALAFKESNRRALQPSLSPLNITSVLCFLPAYSL